MHLLVLAGIGVAGTEGCREQTNEIYFDRETKQFKTRSNNCGDVKKQDINYKRAEVREKKSDEVHEITITI